MAICVITNKCDEYVLYDCLCCYTCVWQIWLCMTGFCCYRYVFIVTAVTDIYYMTGFIVTDPSLLWQVYLCMTGFVVKDISLLW